MTDEEAAAIQERWHWNLVDALPDASQAKADIRALLAERAALRELAEEVNESFFTPDGIARLIEHARVLLGES